MSLQLDTYLTARADGEPIETACERSGIDAAEAKLTEAAIAKGELKLPDIHQEGEVNVPKTDTDDTLVELASDTLRGDVRDTLLGWFKATPKPWSQLGEKEQRDIVDAADRFARSLVKQTCRLIAAGERRCIVAQLVEYKEKDGVEAKLKLPSKGEVVAALHEACGREVLIVCSGEEEFAGEAGEAEIQKDQPELGIGAEYVEA